MRMLKRQITKVLLSSATEVKITQVINRNVDIPGLNEKQEAEMIRKILSGVRSSLLDVL